ncbi:MAG: acyloxyacyl hydrolase [Alphaproteobacteria bacterium]|nr:acyloxyacyl hydrolase [Alphaproteobacteria bacterium]
MKNSSLLLAATSMILMGLVQPASAQETTTDYLNFAIGYFDAFDKHPALDLRVEYRPGMSVLVDNLRPWVGLELTSEATAWLGGGLLYDWNFTDSWYLTPSFGAGFYSQGRSKRNLDYPVQFRSQLEVSYEYDNGIRMGFSVSHLSNAHLNKDNPGTEVMALSLSYPF